MPTTILDGETLEQAYARRFREEAEIDARATCKHKYITTYVDADGEPGGLWGCGVCRARFAPLADQIAVEKQRDELYSNLDKMEGRATVAEVQRDELLAALVKIKGLWSGYAKCSTYASYLIAIDAIAKVKP